MDNGSLRLLLVVSTAFIGIVMTCVVIYTCATDGSPFRAELLTPWMSATLVDFYFNIWFIYVWVLYRETSWLARAAWLVVFVCTGSIGVAAYVLLQLLRAKPSSLAEDVLLRQEPRSRYQGEAESLFGS